MSERTTSIVNSLGLHARPAAQFVKLASSYASHIEVVQDGTAVHGKSLRGVMLLAAEQGSSLTIRADGADAEEAVTALCQLVATGFGET